MTRSVISFLDFRQGRLSRLEYIALIFIIVLIFLLIQLIFPFEMNSWELTLCSLPVWYLGTVFFMRRLHDFNAGKTYWFFIILAWDWGTHFIARYYNINEENLFSSSPDSTPLELIYSGLLVPYIIIIACVALMPGVPHDNVYGPAPKNNLTFLFANKNGAHHNQHSRKAS